MTSATSANSTSPTSARSATPRTPVTTYDRISGMTADQRDALSGQFDKSSRIATAEPIAVIGVGCRFPGAGVGPQRYWEFLTGGGDAIGEVPPDRWDAEDRKSVGEGKRGRRGGRRRRERVG